VRYNWLLGYRAQRVMNPVYVEQGSVKPAEDGTERQQCMRLSKTSVTINLSVLLISKVHISSLVQASKKYAKWFNFKLYTRVHPLCNRGCEFQLVA
jgi:hypothetical protein